jgi:hypothetical protein
MKHYFKWSVHIIIGLIIIVIALLLWRESAWAPQTSREVPQQNTLHK